MEAAASLCPLCGHSQPQPRLQSHSDLDNSTRLLDIIFKHLHIKVHEADKENVCRQCGHTVVAWDEFAQKCWSVQNHLDNISIVKIKTENDNSVEIALQDGPHKYDNDYEDKYNVKNEDPLLNFQTNHDHIDGSFSDEDNQALIKHARREKKSRKQHRKFVSYVCHVCSVEMSDWSTLQDHCSTEHSTKPSILCVCGKYLTTYLAFKKHQTSHGRSKKTKHDRKRLKNELASEDDNDILEDEIEPRKARKRDALGYASKTKPSYIEFKCHLCFVETKSFPALRRHCSTEHSTLARVLCICGKFLRSERGIRYHKIAHTTEKGLKCDQCVKEFLSPYALKSHQETHHRSKEDFTHLCTQCPKKFGNLISLRMHTKRAHEETKVPCDICGLELSSKSSVVQHKLARHDQIKKHVCNICGKAFSAKVNLINHEYTHREERNFKCEECGKAFKYEIILRRHMDTHKEPSIKCPKCPALFRSRHNLRAHMPTHSDVFKFNCKYCGKAFKRRKNLKVHVDSHEGVKRFKCEWCPKTFDCDIKLNVHKNALHPVLPEVEKCLSQDSFASSCEP